MLAVAACIPSNLGVPFTLVLHDRLVPNTHSNLYPDSNESDQLGCSAP
jgi:hypothetical protein